MPQQRHAEDHFELQRMVKAGLSKRVPSGFSDDLQRCIVWMLQTIPDHRPNATELYNQLLETSGKASAPPPSTPDDAPTLAPATPAVERVVFSTNDSTSSI